MSTESSIHSVSSLAKVLQAALSIAYNIDCIFGFAVEVTLDVEFFSGYVAFQFGTFSHVWAYHTCHVAWA